MTLIHARNSLMNRMGFSSIFFILAIFVCLNEGYHDNCVCPPGFEFHGHRCYKALCLFASWQEAKGYCAVVGGDLASIRNTNEQTIVSGIITRQHGTCNYEYYWFDGSDMLNNGWRWMRKNGASVPFDYTNWASGRPANTGERCLYQVYGTNGAWYNGWCHHLISFICEASCTSNRLEIMRYQRRRL